MKRRSIHTCYDKFGGYRAEPGSNANKRRKQKPKQNGRIIFGPTTEIHKKTMADLTAKVEKVVAKNSIRKKWRQQVDELIKAKKSYEDKKRKGEKTAPIDDPWIFGLLGFKEDDIDLDKHLAAVYTLFALIYDRSQRRFNPIIDNDLKSQLQEPLSWHRIDCLLLKDLWQYLQQNDLLLDKMPGKPEIFAPDEQADKPPHREKITLFMFMMNHCVWTTAKTEKEKKKLVKSKRNLLNTYNRKGKIILPTPINKNDRTKGQPYYYYISDLIKEWQIYRDEIPNSLPDLKKKTEDK